MRVLVIEDGHEYEEFARAVLPDVTLGIAHDGASALVLLASAPWDALLVDLRFERAPAEALVGSIVAVADELFAGDEERAARWLKDEQGALILRAIRHAGHAQPAVFVHDFSARRLAYLRSLYGEVRAITNFDAAALRRALGASE